MIYDDKKHGFVLPNLGRYWFLYKMISSIAQGIAEPTTETARLRLQAFVLIVLHYMFAD